MSAKLNPKLHARLKEGFDHQRAARFSQAADAFRDILKFQPKNVDAVHYLGLALWQITEQPDEALKLMRRSLKLAPDSAPKHHNIAAIFGSLGDIDKATGHYKTALKLQPDYAEAYFNLAGVYKFESDDPLIAKMHALYASNSLNDSDQEFLLYALSKAMNDTKNYHEALHFALEGARLKKITHNCREVETSLSELHHNLTKAALAPLKGRGHATDTPIFIVGMPRSGTTLVETILSRHAGIFAAGELPMIGSINHQMRQFAIDNLGFNGTANGFLPLLPDDHFSSAADACQKMVNQRATGAGEQNFKRFTDKMPHNVFRLGLISMLYPNARIIHVKRHPLDTCISCFFQRFRIGHEYSYQLDWLGHYYRHYAMTMAHWRKVLPLPILEISYEKLVQEPEKQSRRLIKFSGLDWDDACLNPQHAERSILTASRWQVRQPIYKSSLNRWQRYEPYLQPLIDSLGGWKWIDSNLSE